MRTFTAQVDMAECGNEDKMVNEEPTPKGTQGGLCALSSTCGSHLTFPPPHLSLSSTTLSSDSCALRFCSSPVVGFQCPPGGVARNHGASRPYHRCNPEIIRGAEIEE